MSLIAGVIVLRPNEPCFNLSELNQKSPDGKSWRRFQIALVIRDGSFAEWRRDMGPAETFTANQFRIPGGVIDSKTGQVEILHTIEELWDIADHLRNYIYEPVQRTNLIQGYYDQMERRKVRGRRSRTNS